MKDAASEHQPDPRIQAMLNALVRQREEAMNACVQLQGDLAVLRAELETLRAMLKAKEDQP